MGARLLGMGEEGWSPGGLGVLWRVGEEGWFGGGSGALWWVGKEGWFDEGSGALWRVGEKCWFDGGLGALWWVGEEGWFDGGSGALWRVGEKGWFDGGSSALWRVGEEGWSSECWTRVGKSMSIVGKIPCNGGENCVWDCWQNGKILSWKMTSWLVKKVFAYISNNLYALSSAWIKFLLRWNNSCIT